MEKKTKKQYYNELKEQYSLTQEHIDFIDKQIELLDRKRNSDGKPSASQELAEQLVLQIDSIFESNEGKGFTATELAKELQPLYEDITLTNQRITAVLNKMITRGKVTRAKDGKKTVFYAV